MARTTSQRKWEAQAVEAVAATAREKKWRCDGRRRTAGEHIIIITIEDQGAIEEIVLSAMMAGEDQGIEYGGLGEGDVIEGTWRPRVVESCACACAYPRCLWSRVHTHMPCYFI
jgi:hypothetical protein